MMDAVLTIHITEGKHGMFYATSPQRKELFVGGRSIYGALEAVAPVLARMDATGRTATPGPKERKA